MQAGGRVFWAPGEYRVLQEAVNRHILPQYVPSMHNVIVIATGFICNAQKILIDTGC